VAPVKPREARAALLERSDLRGSAFCRAYSAEWDRWLADLAARAAGSDTRHLALFAVGGYGREDLCPYSDLDLALVHTGRRNVAAVADAIWYPIWDQGVHLDHSVRRPAEVLDAATDDLRVAMGWLDARLVWGDPAIAETLVPKMLEQWRIRNGQRWLDTLAEQMDERRAAYGDVAFLLEPDLKEARGGLRDVTVLRAIAKCAPALDHAVDLAAVEPARVMLTDARVALHRRAGRELNRLLLQEQDAIATALDYADADALMAAVAQAGRAVAWLGAETWRRQRAWRPAAARSRWSRQPRGAQAGGAGLSPGLLEQWISLGEGEVLLTSDAPVTTDPSLPIRLAAVAGERELPIATGSLHRLAELTPAPGDPWSPETREGLVRTLSAGRPAIDALESLDHHELMVRLLPEWAAVRNLPQRNAYHTYTVDRHLLETAANASGFAERVARPDLLVVAALLHDIGKGFPGDHTTTGIEMASRITRRMGFDAADAATVGNLVRLHLLLPDTATRRDLADPATIDTVAEAVGDRGTLELLAALVEADSLATGPSAWGTWKAALVAELVARTDRRLSGTPTEPAVTAVTDAHRELVAAVQASGRPVVKLEPPRVTVAALDRRGLFAAVAGVLALHGLNVRAADVTGEAGVALELFTVELGPRAPTEEALREDLEAALGRRLALAEELDQRARVYAAGRRPLSARAVVPDVRIDNAASANATVVEVRAADEIGLLHRLTRALFACDLNVVTARVSTIGGEVVDAFYVRDTNGGKVTDPAAVRYVRRALFAVLDRSPVEAASGTPGRTST
jgi:[protein-PII] uridylyltransferase